jgi:hypothetical protein
METQELTIRVTPEAARFYKTASEQQRRTLDLLLSLQLSEAAQPEHSLKELMREASQEAQSRGLTPAILKAILDGR